MDQTMKADTQANNAPRSEAEGTLIIKNYVLNDYEAKIIELWNSGKSAAQIGAVLKVSRNVIIGKIWRLRRKGVSTSEHVRPKSTEPRVRTPRERKPKPLGLLFKQPRPRTALAETVAPVANSKNIKFRQLKNNSCRYVTNDGRPENFLFCGAPKERGPYCEAHALICYVPPRSPERKQHNPNGMQRYYR